MYVAIFNYNTSVHIMRLTPQLSNMAIYLFLRDVKCITPLTSTAVSWPSLNDLIHS